MDKTIIVAVLAIFASAGFWSFITKMTDKKSAKARLLMGIAYHNICDLCLMYIHRGSISADEYADLKKYFYQPYRDMGGNGVCERLMNEVDRLPIKEEPT